MTRHQQVGVLLWPNQNFPPQLLKNKFTADKPPLRMRRFGSKACETADPHNSAISMLAVVDLHQSSNSRSSPLQEKSQTYQVTQWPWADFFVSTEWGERWNEVAFPTCCQHPSKGVLKKACLKQMRADGQTPSFSYLHIYQKNSIPTTFPTANSQTIFLLLLNVTLFYLEISATMSKLWNTRVKQ